MTDPNDDAAAVEAVARAIYGVDAGCDLWVGQWDELDGGARDGFRAYARHAIAAMRALGWVDGANKAKLTQRVNNLERGLFAATSERDTLRLALEKILAWSDHPQCGRACRDIARDALAAVKDTP